MEPNSLKTRMLSSFYSEHPDSAASLLLRTDVDQIVKLITATPDKTLISTLSLLPVNLLEESLAKLETTLVSSILSQLEINLAGTIFRQWIIKNRMDTVKIDSILSSLGPQLSLSIKTLLQYPTNAIGSVMNPTPFYVNQNLTVGDILSILKKDKNRYCRYVYIVNENLSLRGVVPFKDIFYADETSIVSSIMCSDIVVFHPEDSIRKSFTDPCWKKWTTMPVVNHQNNLIGLIRFETLEAQILSQGKKSLNQDNEVQQAGNAISEVFQIGLNATVTSLMLPLQGYKKS